MNNLDDLDKRAAHLVDGSGWSPSWHWPRGEYGHLNLAGIDALIESVETKIKRSQEDIEEGRKILASIREVRKIYADWEDA